MVSGWFMMVYDAGKIKPNEICETILLSPT